MDHSHDHHEHMIHDFQSRFWISFLLTIPIILLSPMFKTGIVFKGDLYVLFSLSALVYLYGGWPFLNGLWSELRAKQPGMMTLIGLAITVAFIYSAFVVFGLSGNIFFWELATLIDIMLLGHWIEMRSVLGASKALEKLVMLLPAVAHRVLSDGSIRDVPLEQLAVGDHILIRPGEKVAADGVVRSGESSVNEALLTGESLPVKKRDGAGVIGGSLNGEGSLTVEIQKMGQETFLSQVIELVKAAQESKSKTQNLADRAAMWLTIIAVVIGLITFFVWLLFTSQGAGFALERSVTVMVIACPHALGLAVPLVVAVSTALAAQSGLLIRNRAAFESARNIEAVIFDKTGTLTEGKFGITDILLLGDKSVSREELLAYAGSIESRSEHLLAKAIAAYSIKKWDVQEFRAIPGKGAEGKVKGKFIQVVSPGYLKEVVAKLPAREKSKILTNPCQNPHAGSASGGGDILEQVGKPPLGQGASKERFCAAESFATASKEHHIEIDDPRISQLSKQGKTVIFVLMDNQLIGAIALADLIRKESKEAIHKLKQMGIRCLMVTGDNPQVAKWVADELQLDEYFAEILPHDKAKKVREVQARGLTVAMIGDGVNDAPALAQSDVGIAIGAGTDIAIEAADIILVKNNPLDAVAILSLARNTYRKMAQNLIWATGYNAIAIPLAAGVLYEFGIVLTPALGAIFMSLSTVICAVNANLLKKAKS